MLERSVGNYHLLVSLGEGASGSVFLASDSKGQLVAVKTLWKNQQTVISTNEVEMMQAYPRHPNVVSLFEKLEIDGTTHLIMEYVGPDNLLEYVNRTGCLNEDMARFFFKGMLEGLDHLHNSGIVHRDIKCENILLTSELKPVICDLGYACKWSATTKLEEFCGSLQYASPEILQKKSYLGPEVDIWSLGVVLYAIIAGRLPWGQEPYEIITFAPVGDYLMLPHFSPGLLNLFDNILQPNGHRRWTSDLIKISPWYNCNELRDESETKRASTLSKKISHGFRFLFSPNSDNVDPDTLPSMDPNSMSNNPRGSLRLLKDDQGKKRGKIQRRASMEDLPRNVRRQSLEIVRNQKRSEEFLDQPTSSGEQSTSTTPVKKKLNEPVRKRFWEKQPVQAVIPNPELVDAVEKFAEDKRERAKLNREGCVLDLKSIMAAQKQSDEKSSSSSLSLSLSKYSLKSNSNLLSPKVLRSGTLSKRDNSSPTTTTTTSTTTSTTTTTTTTSSSSSHIPIFGVRRTTTRLWEAFLSKKKNNSTDVDPHDPARNG